MVLTPIEFIIGNDGLPYAVLPNHCLDPNHNPQLYCCGGFYNAVRLAETIGM